MLVAPITGWYCNIHYHSVNAHVMSPTSLPVCKQSHFMATAATAAAATSFCHCTLCCAVPRCAGSWAAATPSCATACATPLTAVAAAAAVAADALLLVLLTS
jgi:hypothetical protein